MSYFKVDKNFSERLFSFINSPYYLSKNEISKSEYWKLHSSLIDASITNDGIRISGVSGIYIPKKPGFFGNFFRKINSAFRSPIKILYFLKRCCKDIVSFPKLISYRKSFDLVMMGSEVSDPDLSPYLINHKLLKSKSQIFYSAKDVESDYKSWSGFLANDHIYNAYYYMNIIAAKIPSDSSKIVLEIGPGTCNLCSILYEKFHINKYILIDLPETTVAAIAFINSLHPNSKILMPHEIDENFMNQDFNFAFLTVDQIDKITSNSIDLAINTHSFQEMTQEQISIYFGLIQRVCRQSGYFFSANRVFKIPANSNAYTETQKDPPNWSMHYPWVDSNEDLINELSKFSRLVQLDPIHIRLQKIVK